MNTISAAGRRIPIAGSSSRRTSCRVTCIAPDPEDNIVKQTSRIASMLVLVSASALLADSGTAQPEPVGKRASSSAPFPSEHAKEIKWFDSLARGIRDASAAKKPICLILAGQRPSGDC